LQPCAIVKLMDPTNLPTESKVSLPDPAGEDKPQVDAMVGANTTKPGKGKLDDLYMSWKTDPSPQNMNAVVGALGPSIGYALNMGGSGQDKLLKAEARLIAAEAVKTYNPESGAGLNTWASTQLMRLKRKKRELNAPVRVPERIQLDAWTLEKAERTFLDKYDREPAVNELADKTGIPVKRIAKVRESFRIMPTEGAVEGAAAHETPNYMDEALAYVHEGLDSTSRKVLEHKTGYGGAEVLTPLEIQKRFKLSASKVSRISKRLTFQINEIQDMLDEMQEQ